MKGGNRNGDFYGTGALCLLFEYAGVTVPWSILEIPKEEWKWFTCGVTLSPNRVPNLICLRPNSYSTIWLLDYQHFWPFSEIFVSRFFSFQFCVVKSSHQSRNRPNKQAGIGYTNHRSDLPELWFSAKPAIFVDRFIPWKYPPYSALQTCLQ